MLIIDQSNKNNKSEYRTSKHASIDAQLINKDSSFDIRNS